MALCAPLCAILIFIVPLDITPTIPLQPFLQQALQFWSSGSTGILDHQPREDMTRWNNFLPDILNECDPDSREFPGPDAHKLAAAFLAFKFGLYANAVRECSQRCPKSHGK